MSLNFSMGAMRFRWVTSSVISSAAFIHVANTARLTITFISTSMVRLVMEMRRKMINRAVGRP